MPNACLFLPSPVGFGCIKESKRLLFTRKSSDRLSTDKYRCCLTLPLTHSASSYTSQLRRAGSRQISQNKRHPSLCNIFLLLEGCAVIWTRHGGRIKLVFYGQVSITFPQFTLVPLAFLGAVDVVDSSATILCPVSMQLLKYKMVVIHTMRTDSLFTHPLAVVYFNILHQHIFFFSAFFFGLPGQEHWPSGSDMRTDVTNSDTCCISKKKWILRHSERLSFVVENKMQCFLWARIAQLF